MLEIKRNYRSVDWKMLFEEERCPIKLDCGIYGVDMHYRSYIIDQYIIKLLNLRSVNIMWEIFS